MPTTVTTTATVKSTEYASARHIIQDAYGKLIAVTSNGNLQWSYCNSPPSGSWTSQDLGASYAISTDLGYGMAGIAYDPTNDIVMMTWVDTSSPALIKVGELTPTRDGSHNITGKTLSSILTLTLANGKAGKCPSIILLHNGEFGLVCGDNSTSGAKSGTLEGCRIVEGNPPTYKSFTGTASTMTKISTTYTIGHTQHTGTLCERTNAGTGQYDIWVFWQYGIIATKKNRGVWGSPSWTFTPANEANTTLNVNNNIGVSCAYNSYDGNVIYGGNTEYSYLGCGQITTSNTDTDISPSSISGVSETGITILSNGTIYMLHCKSASQKIWRIARASGSWGSDTECTTSNYDNTPAIALSPTNRIDFIYIYFNGSNYDVYYDSLSLAAVTETIVAMNFPMLYLSKPVKAEELISKVEGATITVVCKEFPQQLIKAGKANELRDKWTS